MCRWYLVSAIQDDGTPVPGVPPEIEFEEQDDWTTCTCWIGDKEGDGAKLRERFVEECLRPYLERVSYGKIIIEVR